MKAALSALLLCAVAASAQQKPWRSVLEERLAVYGHRNWIVIADSAYPLQSNPGIETILSSDSQIETVRQALNAILFRAKHLRPVVYTDKELSFVPEGEAIGISGYRQELAGVFQRLGTQPAQPILHENVIRKLDEAARSFNVLIIKTSMALPYTSVFIELRAGYWDDAAEDRLRQNMK